MNNAVRIRRLPVITTLLSALWIAPAAVAQSSARGGICDMGMAREWCDSTPLARVEGIWEFPQDRTRVLISRDPSRPGGFVLTVIDTPDTRLTPGERIGTLSPSAHPDRFELELPRMHNGLLPSSFAKCLAEYDASRGVMTVSGRKLKLSVTARWLLPSFWRALKLTHTDPLDRLPDGLVRIYPAPVATDPQYL